MVTVINSPTESVWVASWVEPSQYMDDVRCKFARVQKQGEAATRLTGEVGGRYAHDWPLDQRFLYVDRMDTVKDARLCGFAAERYDATLVPRWDALPEEVRQYLRLASETGEFPCEVWRNTSPPVQVQPYSPLEDVHGDGSGWEGSLLVKVAHKGVVRLHFTLVEVDGTGKPVHPEGVETLAGAAMISGSVPEALARVEMNDRLYVVCAAPHEGDPI